jgi:hypothetical protein
MRKLLIIIILFTSCQPYSGNNATATDSLYVVGISDTVIKDAQRYKSIRLVDSFFNINKNKILQSTALREHYEGLCTKEMLPLIDKKGLYDDLPLEFTASAITMVNLMETLYLAMINIS